MDTLEVPYRLARVGTVMVPEPDRAEEAEGVLNPASGYGPDGRLYLLPRVVGHSTATIPVAVPTSALATGFLIDGLGLDRARLVLTAAALLVGACFLASPWTRHLDTDE